MATENTKVVVKQPAVFKLNSKDDFPTWYAQFKNYADSVGIGADDFFKALSSFLDTPAFTVVQNLKVPEADKKDEDKFKPILTAALTRKEKIPPRLALRYRAQEPEESLAEFAFALELLANKANIPDDSKPEMLVDSFCTGVRDTDLSIKLLETNFASLSLAVDQAQKIEGASKIRNFVRPSSSTANPEQSLEILATNPAPANTGRPVTYQQNQQPNANFGNAAQHLDYNAPSFQPNHHHTAGYGNSRFDNGSRYVQNNHTSYNRPRNSGLHNQFGNGNGAYQGNRNVQKRCWFCNRVGHLIRNCRTRANNEAQNFQTRPSPRQ